MKVGQSQGSGIISRKLMDKQLAVKDSAPATSRREFLPLSQELEVQMSNHKFFRLPGACTTYLKGHGL
jgi:hypothetical protein